VATLIVRNLDLSIVETLKKRAARRGRSAEAEHRAILKAALARTRHRTFAEALAAMPNAGQDDDYARRDDAGKRDVFD
jgi:plasmid stability protein